MVSRSCIFAQRLPRGLLSRRAPQLGKSQYEWLANVRGQRWRSDNGVKSTLSDQEIVHLASVPLHPLSLSDLVKYGRPPLSEKSLLSSARFTLSLLPPRLAHRLHAIRSLPYIVVSNPHISQIYRNYLHSLSTLLPFYRAGIETAADEAAFTDALADLVQTHANTIPVLARGLKECSRYLGDGEGRIGATFLDEHLRARIGTRLVAEQHLALHLATNFPSGGEVAAKQEQQQQNDRDTHEQGFVGVIDTALSPVAILRRCEDFVGELCELRYGVRPSVTLHGDIDAHIAHVPTHLEYILTELLKNAFRATIENGREREPIEATISLGCDSPAASSPSTRPVDKSVARVADGRPKDGGQGGVAFTMPTSGSNGQVVPSSSLTIRIRDQGGGIAPDILPHIWDYSFTTFDEDDDRAKGSGLSAISAAGAEGAGTIAGLGYGLPLGRAYAEHFNGELNIESLWGWGTDVYLRLRGLETGVS